MRKKRMRVAACLGFAALLLVAAPVASATASAVPDTAAVLFLKDEPDKEKPEKPAKPEKPESEAPGQSAEAPGQTGENPGQTGAAPPGQTENPGSSEGAPPGQTENPGNPGNPASPGNPGNPGSYGSGNQHQNQNAAGPATPAVPAIPASHRLLTPVLDSSPPVLGIGDVDQASGGDEGGWADPVDRLLAPVLPPAVRDAVTAPLVLAEALVSALASSSHVLILPALLVLAGLSSRRARQRLLALVDGGPVDQ